MKKKKKLRKGSFVVFDRKSCTDKEYENFYKSKFGKNEYMFMGEIPNAKGHCMLYNCLTQKMEGMYHIENFKEK